MNLKLLALKELNGEASTSELQALEEDYGGWHDALNDLYRDTIEKIMECKSATYAAGKNSVALAEFVRLKEKLILTQNKIISKKRVVKELLHEENQRKDEAQKEEQNRTKNPSPLEAILCELQAIRQLLEPLKKPASVKKK